MGYRGKLVEREQGRRLRGAGLPLPSNRFPGSAAAAAAHPNALKRRKQAEIDRLLDEGRTRVDRLSEREFLVAGIALYAGEGGKGDGSVRFANTDARMIGFFCTWLRRFFEIDERRLRVTLYLHEGLDLGAATAYWSEVTGVPPVAVRQAVPSRT